MMMGFLMMMQGMTTRMEMVMVAKKHGCIDGPVVFGDFGRHGWVGK